MLSSESGMAASQRAAMAKPGAAGSAPAATEMQASPARQKEPLHPGNAISGMTLGHQPVLSRRLGFDMAGMDIYEQVGRENLAAVQHGNIPVNLSYRGRDLRGADLSATMLARADMRQADLRGTNLQGAIMQEFPFRADLKGANLSGTDLSWIVTDRPVGFSGPFDARGAVYNRLTRFPPGYRPAGEGLIFLVPGADVTGANLSGVPASGMDLGGVNFSGAFLRNTDLRGVNLSGSDLTGAWLQGADLRNIMYDDDTRFAGATYSDKTLFPEDFNPARRGMVLENPMPLSAYVPGAPESIPLLDWLPLQS